MDFFMLSRIFYRGERDRGIEVNGCMVEYFFWKNYTLTSPLAPLPEERGIAFRDF
jgi:hypothetical protein